MATDFEPLHPPATTSEPSSRVLIGGGQAASMVSKQILQNVQSGANTAEILQMGDVSVVAVHDSNVVGLSNESVNCTDVVCTFDLSEGIGAFVGLDYLGSYDLFGDTKISRPNTTSLILRQESGESNKLLQAMLVESSGNYPATVPTQP